MAESVHAVPGPQAAADEHRAASARAPEARSEGNSRERAPDLPRHLVHLQRTAGNRAVAGLLRPQPVVQRLKLEDGPPLAPGNYRYGSLTVSMSPAAMRKMLVDMAGRDGLEAEKRWQLAFVADMRAQGGGHTYEDPDAKQSVKVEPTLAARADDAQVQVGSQAAAAQTQFQQSMLASVGDLLGTSEKKLQAEGRRYGFPDDRSILEPKRLQSGAAAILPSMPGSDELRGSMLGAKHLLDGKQKLKKARESIVKSGPILGDFMRPSVLEPAVREYHSLRQKVCGQYPLLAAVERNEERLAELASGAQFAGPGTKGQPAAEALVKAKEELRKELADRLSNISYIRAGMKDQDKIDKFWMDQPLRENTKRALAITPTSLPNAAVEDKVTKLHADAVFEGHLKEDLGVALLVASFIPGVAPVAGALGLIAGAVDVNTAFQQYYWEQAAVGTAMEKAEAISQTEPSLYGLAVSIAFGLLEGVAEAKALEGAIDVFKVVRLAYREARAAGVAAKIGSGAAKTSAAAELVTATEKLKTTADQAGGKPGLGARIAADMGNDVQATAASLDRSLKIIEDPGLKELVRRSSKPITAAGETLMDLAIRDPHGLAGDFAEWQSSKSGKPFEDWLRDMKGFPEHGILNEPAGLVEYGLTRAEGAGSFDRAVREDPTREIGLWEDPATGEYVCVQGKAEGVSHDWMSNKENFRHGKQPQWALRNHNHPNRGLAIDRIPSPSDFGHITRYERMPGGTPKPVTSAVTWTDPASKIKFQTEFGYLPGTDRGWWTRYRVDDGTTRLATWAERPGSTGAYQEFINNFTGKPTDPVPGGNMPPVVIPEPPPTVPDPSRIRTP